MSHPTSPISRFVLGAALCSLPFAVSCDKLGVPSNPSDALNAGAGCPDISSVSAIMKIDWAKEFGVDASVGGKLQAGVRAAVELKGFAAELDAKLVTACGGLARDLGKGGSFKTGEEACKAAMAAMGEIKGKLGASAKISLAVALVVHSV